MAITTSMANKPFDPFQDLDVDALLAQPAGASVSDPFANSTIVPNTTGTVTTSSIPWQTLDTVQGVMVEVQHSFPDNTDEDTMKRDLISMIAEEIYKRKLVEFTKVVNYSDFDWTCRARIFVTPNDKVKMLREKGW